jgi:hypothetical protein
MAAHCPGSVARVVLAGHMIVGGCVSLTVTVNEQADPDAGVQITVVAPLGKVEPDGGTQVTESQLPVVVVV